LQPRFSFTLFISLNAMTESGIHFTVRQCPAQVPAKYEPTAYERRATAAYLARKKAKPTAPRMKVSEKDRVTTLSPDHPEPSIGHIRLLEALGNSLCVLEKTMKYFFMEAGPGAQAERTRK
jgi:hypothetical protein